MFYNITCIPLLTHFMPLVSFDTSWKRRCFQGVSKVTSGMKWVKRYRKYTKLNSYLTKKHYCVTLKPKRMYKNVTSDIFLQFHWVKHKIACYKKGNWLNELPATKKKKKKEKNEKTTSLIKIYKFNTED